MGPSNYYAGRFSYHYCPPPIQAISQTSQVQQVHQTQAPVVSATGGAAHSTLTTASIATGAGSVQVTTTATIVSSSTTIQVPTITNSQYISPLQMVNNIRPPYTTLAQYAPTWSVAGPQMSVGHTPFAQPGAQQSAEPRLAQELLALRQQLARLEGVVGIHQPTNVSSSLPSNWSATGGPAHNGPPVNVSPALAGPATGAGMVPTTYSQLMFSQPQGLGITTSYQPTHGSGGLQRVMQPCNTVYPTPPELAGVGAGHQDFTARLPAPIPGLRSLQELGDLTRYAPFPGIQEKVIRNAVAGMFATLDDFLYATHVDNLNEGQLVMDSATNQVVFKPHTAARKVTNFSTWLEAYLNYMKVMINAHGLIAYHSMSDYITFIQKNDARFYWYAVDSFDGQHRQWLSGKSINMLNIDPIIVAATLVSSAARTEARCVVCKSPEHSTADCTAAAAMPPVSRRNRSSSRGKKPEEICKKFNKKHCSFQGCRRAHKCIVCKGDLPIRECLIRGPCADQEAS